jgi:MerC mercury resistance protein
MSTIQSLSPALTPLPVQSRRPSPWLRWLGGSLSVACAVHCAVVPLLLVLMPSLAMVSIKSHPLAVAIAWFAHYEAWIIGAGMLVTAITIWMHGHTCPRAWRWFAVALLCNVLGLTIAHDHLMLHSVFMISGGVFMLLAALRHAAHRH